MKIARIVALLLLASSRACLTHAQLAITEVMAESSVDPVTGSNFPDFWELTNFGVLDLQLDGHGFFDNLGTQVNNFPFSNLVIRAGQSIVFCRTSGVHANFTLEKFKAWWGEENLPLNLQVGFYSSPGLDGSVGDEIWLVDPFTNVVDMVAFEASQPGRTFAYDRETGSFGVPSVPEVNGAFRAAAKTNDVGSPGFTSGAVPLGIREQPLSQTLEEGAIATFSVVAIGMPRPKYQWTSNGLPILGATRSALTIPEIQPAAAAEYRVILNNGLMERVSAPAILIVNTNPFSPMIVRAPSDRAVFAGQTAIFAVEARGFPLLQYQWQSNAVPIPDQTNRTLAVAVPANSPPFTATVSVSVRNELGSTNVSAQLAVVRRPKLAITELMSAPTNGPSLGHLGWFELTNLDTHEVNLEGYRFRDAEVLAVATTITNRVIIKPRESVIFVEFMSPEEFIRWWGAENLPPGLQVLTWGRWGLSARGEDSIHVWNPGATDSYDTVVVASHLEAIPGLSQELDNYCNVFGVSGCITRNPRESVAGTNGAFRAAVGGDVGSPGYTTNPPPRFIGLLRDVAGIGLRCRVNEGGRYRLVRKSALPEPAWTPLETRVATNSIITLWDTSSGSVPARFYRLEALP